MVTAFRSAAPWPSGQTEKKKKRKKISRRVWSASKARWPVADDTDGGHGKIRRGLSTTRPTTCGRARAVGLPPAHTRKKTWVQYVESSQSFSRPTSGAFPRRRATSAAQVFEPAGALRLPPPLGIPFPAIGFGPCWTVPAPARSPPLASPGPGSFNANSVFLVQSKNLTARVRPPTAPFGFIQRVPAVPFGARLKSSSNATLSLEGSAAWCEMDSDDAIPPRRARRREGPPSQMRLNAKVSLGRRGTLELPKQAFGAPLVTRRTVELCRLGGVRATYRLDAFTLPGDGPRGVDRH